jgi:hypothetical protein
MKQISQAVNLTPKINVSLRILTSPCFHLGEHRSFGVGNKVDEEQLEMSSIKTPIHQAIEQTWETPS